MNKPKTFKTAADAMRGFETCKFVRGVAISASLSSNGAGFLQAGADRMSFFDADGVAWGYRVRCIEAPSAESDGKFKAYFEELEVSCGNGA